MTTPTNEEVKGKPMITKEINQELIETLKMVLAVWLNEIDPDEYAKQEQRLREAIKTLEGLEVEE